MLADEADWNAETWAVRPDLVDPLARTLETLLQRGPSRVAVLALWAGDRPTDQVEVTVDELVRIVRTTGLGTKRRYNVLRGAAQQTDAADERR